MFKIEGNAYTGRVIVTYVLEGKRHRNIWDGNFNKKAVEEGLIKRGATNISFYKEKIN